jgi:hypothetical protein
MMMSTGLKEGNKEDIIDDGGKLADAAMEMVKWVAR